MPLLSGVGQDLIWSWSRFNRPAYGHDCGVRSLFGRKIRSLGEPSQTGERIAMPDQKARDGCAVRGAIRVGEARDLGVHAAVAGPVADCPHHRPSDAALITHLCDRSRLHVQRYHATRSQIGMHSRIRAHLVGGAARTPSGVQILPWALPTRSGVGRYTEPSAPFTTCSGSTSAPIGVSSSIAPVMPTTTTHSMSTASSNRAVALPAKAVPIPVTIAITARSPTLPT